MPADPFCPLHEEEIALNRRNFTKVVLEGRKPGLELEVFGGDTLPLAALGERYFAELAEVAGLLDACCGRGCYGKAHQQQLEAIRDPSLTLSARVLKELVASNEDILPYGLALSRRYQALLQQSRPRFWEDGYFDEEGVRSLARQRKIERADTLSFDEFLQGYFSHQQL